MKEKNNKLTIIIVAIILTLLALLIILFCIHKGNNKNVNSTTTMTKKEKVVWSTPTGNNGTINIYYDSLNNKLLIPDNKELDDALSTDKNYKLKYVYKCSNSDCKSIGIYEDLGYVLINDGGYILYNYKNDLFSKININETGYKSIKPIYFSKKIYGYLLINEDNTIALYNNVLNKIITDYKYKLNSTYDYSFSPEIIDNNYIMLDDNNTYHLIDFKTGKEKHTNNIQDYELSAVCENGNVYYIKKYVNEISHVEICNRNLKPIIKGKYTNYSINSKGNVIVETKDNKYSIYNKKGTLIKTSKEYIRLYNIVNDYIIVLDSDNYIKIVDYDGRVLAKFIKNSDNIVVHNEISGIRKKGASSQVFVIIENAELEEGVVGKYTEYYYDSKTKKSDSIKLYNIDDYKL